MEYKLHTQQRFTEKFIPIFKKSKINNEWSEMTDEDYFKLCEICRNKPLYIQPGKSRVIARYNDTTMWCVLTKKTKIVKTIYPVDRADIRKFLVNS
jgi:hypothetical protein